MMSNSCFSTCENIDRCCYGFGTLGGCISLSGCQPCIPECPRTCPGPIVPRDIGLISSLVTGSAPQAVVSGGADLPASLPAGSVLPPAGTVAIVSNLQASLANGVSLSNTTGVATASIAGTYQASASVCFARSAIVDAVTDLRVATIYRLSGSSFTAIASAAVVPVAADGEATCLNLSGSVSLNTGDRIFLAVRQTSGSAETIQLQSARFTVMKI